MTTRPAAVAAIRVRGLRKSYGKVEVLRGVDLVAERGGVLALLGSNGRASRCGRR